MLQPVFGASQQIAALNLKTARQFTSEATAALGQAVIHREFAPLVDISKQYSDAQSAKFADYKVALTQILAGSNAQVLAGATVLSPALQPGAPAQSFNNAFMGSLDESTVPD